MFGKELCFSFFKTGLFCRTGVSSHTLELSSANIVFELFISLVPFEQIIQLTLVSV